MPFRANHVRTICGKLEKINLMRKKSEEKSQREGETTAHVAPKVRRE